VNKLLDRFAAVANGLAILNDYPFAQRQPQWLQRLAVNAPELDALLQDGETAELGYLQPPAVTPAAGGVPVSAEVTGMAALARRHRNDPATIVHSVRSAWQTAQETASLNAFTHLASWEQLTQQMAALPQDDSMQSAALLGVPIAIKDLMRVQGFPMTGGSGHPAPDPQQGDALAVARLRQAGAVILGTTNLHELAYGITSENPHHGWVGNPRAEHLTSGGSSGGSAAAVAAGIVRMALGTDTAGSIRIPAACCGVVGFKPSFDAIPRTGVMTLGSSLDHVGPIAASVQDAALAFSMMAGLPARVADTPVHLRGIRIGVPQRYFFDPLAPEVQSAMDRALTLLRQDGATLVPVDIDGIHRSGAIQFTTLCSEAVHQHWERLIHQPDTLGEDVRVRLEIGQFLPARWYVRAQHLRTNLVQAMHHAMHDVDLLVTPTLRIPPPARGQTHVSLDGVDRPLQPAVTGLTLPFNLSGMPAITLPCQPPGQLPIGIQFAGRQGEDWHVLNIAARLEQLLKAG